MRWIRQNEAGKPQKGEVEDANALFPGEDATPPSSVFQHGRFDGERIKVEVIMSRRRSEP